MEQCDPLNYKIPRLASLSDSHVLFSSLELAADSLALFHCLKLPEVTPNSLQRSPGSDTMDSSRGASPPARLADRAQPSPVGQARGGGRG